MSAYICTGTALIPDRSLGERDAAMRDSMGTQAHATGEARMLRSLPRTRWLACLSGSSRNLLYRNRTSGAPPRRDIR
ncbi:MAG: hypothetical protein OSJ25_01640 [Paramuribaculum sp.]|nr:hypothetical protein [Paramuribaculum sp.]